jgi:hypothetical protein
LCRQYALQVTSYNTIPGKLDGEERGRYVTYNHTALIKELGEALDEIAWKPWSVDKTTFNRRLYLKELADAFHFFENLILVALLDGQDIPSLALEFAKMYFDKADVNTERMASGTYDGFSTKCPDCGRAVEDGERKQYADELNLSPALLQYVRREAYHCQCGRMNYIERSLA